MVSQLTQQQEQTCVELQAQHQAEHEQLKAQVQETHKQLAAQQAQHAAEVDSLRKKHLEQIAHLQLQLQSALQVHVPSGNRSYARQQLSMLRFMFLESYNTCLLPRGMSANGAEDKINMQNAEIFPNACCLMPH